MSRHARIEVRPISNRSCFLAPGVDGLDVCIEHALRDCPTFGPAHSQPHYLRLVAANGAVLATSEVYASRRNARRAVGAWREAFRQVGAQWRDASFVEFDADGREVQR